MTYSMGFYGVCIAKCFFELLWNFGDICAANHVDKIIQDNRTQICVSKLYSNSSMEAEDSEAFFLNRVLFIFL